MGSLPDSGPSEVIGRSRAGPWLALLAAVLVSGVFFVRIGPRPTTGPSSGGEGPPEAPMLPTPPTSVAPAMSSVDLTPEDLLKGFGPEAVVEQIVFSAEAGAFLLCRASNRELGLERTLSVVGYADPPVGDAYVASWHEITLPSAPGWTDCRACVGDTVQLDGEPILHGSCRDGGSDGASTAYAIAPPRRLGGSPLALDIRCGATFLEADGDQLVLTGHSAGADEGLGPVPHPPIRLSRRDGEFVADDEELLRRNCYFGDSAQLHLGPDLSALGRPSLSYREQDSAIGVLGIHRAVVVALTDEQCAMLTDAWWADDGAHRIEERTEEDSPVADVTGLPLPDGLSDWHFTCLRVAP